MNGDWSLTSGGKVLSIDMVYRPGSKDSIMIEQFGKELSVFSMDGSDLVMTHFCNAGNQPRLKLAPPKGDGRYVFELFDIVNLAKPNDAHVHRVIYTVSGPTEMTLELVWKQGDEEASEHYTLTKER